MKYTYSYNQPIGYGVDIYIVDSGVRVDHVEFNGRAKFGWAAPGLAWEDGHGHGTHMAGIAAGRVFGVAKKANIIAVRVLGNDNTGSISHTIAGLDWISANVVRTKKPSIVCMAMNIRSEYNDGLDEAVTELVSRGVTTVVSAGNFADEASEWPPASAPGAIVVGASDITNAMWEDSNFGEAVDVFAPGVWIRAAGHTGLTDTAMGTGTSQAAAHVAGIAANFLSRSRSLTPALILNEILSLTTKNAISGVSEGTTTNFVFNGAPYPPTPPSDPSAHKD